MKRNATLQRPSRIAARKQARKSALRIKGQKSKQKEASNA